MIDSDHSYFRDRIEKQDAREAISMTQKGKFTDESGEDRYTGKLY